MAESFRTFREFYPFYLSEHSHPICRRLHFVGSLLVLACAAVAALTRSAWWLAAAPLVGYGCAWIARTASSSDYRGPRRCSCAASGSPEAR